MGERTEHSERNKTKFWSNEAASVLSGIRMHRLTGQFEKGRSEMKRTDRERWEKETWGNITEHCLVETARAEVLGNWIGIPKSIITEIKVGAVLHDFSKKLEIEVTREANKSGNSPLDAVNAEHEESESLLRQAGFNDRIIRLASSAGGLAPQLVECQKILDKPALSDNDWAYLIVHYVDDCSIGSDWVKPSQLDTDGSRKNIIDFRMQENREKSVYNKISEEVNGQLSHYPQFREMDNLDASAFVSHQIEQRLAQRIKEKTGEAIDPLTIPELVDQKIREAIEKYGEAS